MESEIVGLVISALAVLALTVTLFMTREPRAAEPPAYLRFLGEAERDVAEWMGAKRAGDE